MRSLNPHTLGALVFFVALPFVPSAVIAADLPLKAPAAPAWVAPWTGFYVGANVGAGFASKQLYDIFPTPDFALDASPNIPGWVGGLQLGYNYQFRWLVVGVEGSWDWAGLNGSFGCFSFGNQQCTLNSEWFGTVVGKAGVAVGSALVFVDGGAAWTRDAITDVATTAASRGGVPSLPGDLFTGSQIRSGWTVGGGVEYALSHNWSVFAAYSYMNFGEKAITLDDGLGNSFPEEVKQTVQLVKVGFDYRFNGAGVGTGSSPIMSYAAAPSIEKDSEPTNTIRAFSVLDVAKYQIDGLVGGLIALRSDIDTSGPRLWIEGGGGAYQFFRSGGAVRGFYSTGSILGGYAFEGKNYEINLLAGLSAENDILSVNDPSDPVKGTAAGFKVRADTFYNPTPRTLFYGEGEYSTAFQTYWTSAKWGYDPTKDNKGIFVGPEVTAFGDARFNQVRIGAHVSEVQFLKMTLDISAGFDHDSLVGNGAYSHIELSREF